jgi:hypothetical protein
MRLLRPPISMAVAISVAPLIFFVATVILCRYQWRRALVLFFIGPIVATFLVMIGGIEFDTASGTGVDISAKSLPWLPIFFFLLFGVKAIYPRGAWVAMFTLLAWRFLGHAPEDRFRHERLLSGLMVGLLAATFTVVALFLVFHSSALVHLIEVPNDPNTRHPSPLSLQITMLTGLCDGLLLVCLINRRQINERSE